MEHEIYSAGGGPTRLASASDTGFRIRVCAQPCRVQDHHQQLHVPLLQQAVPDRTRRRATGHEAPKLTGGTLAQRRVEGALSRALCGHLRVWRQTAGNAETAPAQTGPEGSQCRRQKPLDGWLLEPTEPAALADYPSMSRMRALP